jgi:FkbM family methyltransferase
LQREPPEIRPKTQDTTGWLFDGSYRNGMHHVAVPWIHRKFQELMLLEPQRDDDTKVVAICSGKTKTLGQRQRLILLKRLCELHPDLIDVYGRGLDGSQFSGCYRGPIETRCKFQVLSQYRFCLACENSSHPNYFTEKLVDCFLALTFPIYWGCPNLSEFFPPESYESLESLMPLDRAIDTVVQRVNGAPINLDALKEARRRVLQVWNIWPSLHGILTVGRFYGQFRQDQRVYELFFKQQRRQQGVFVDVGASDGVTFSNTFFFENTLGWTGLCIEPRPSAFRDLVRNRRCLCANVAVGDPEADGDLMQFVEYRGWGSGLSGIAQYYDPRHLERIKREELHPDHRGKTTYNVIVQSLADRLETHELYEIDYLSIDIEGPELKVLKTLDYDRFRIKVIDVENNYRTADIRNFLRTKGYRFVERIGVDELYVRDDL